MRSEHDENGGTRRPQPLVVGLDVRSPAADPTREIIASLSMAVGSENEAGGHRGGDCLTTLACAARVSRWKSGLRRISLWDSLRVETVSISDLQAAQAARAQCQMYSRRVTPKGCNPLAAILRRCSVPILDDSRSG